MAMSSTDLQLVEKGVINLRAICNVFGLDSSLFNDPANKTFNNRKEAEKALYTNAIIPIVTNIVIPIANPKSIVFCFISEKFYHNGIKMQVKTIFFIRKYFNTLKRNRAKKRRGL